MILLSNHKLDRFRYQLDNYGINNSKIVGKKIKLDKKNIRFELRDSCGRLVNNVSIRLNF